MYLGFFSIIVFAKDVKIVANLNYVGYGFHIVDLQATISVLLWARWLSWYSEWLRAARFGDRNPVGARFCAPVQSGPVAHPASCIAVTGSLPGVKSSRGVTLTPNRVLVSWSGKRRAKPLLPLWAVRTVQSLSD